MDLIALQNFPSGVFWVGDNYQNEGVERQLSKVYKVVEDQPDISIEELEEMARKLKSDNMFFMTGNAHKLSGKNDKKLSP